MNVGREEAAPTVDATHVVSRRVGRAVVTAISLGRLYWAPQMQAPEEEWRRAMPDADAQGRIPCELTVVHIRTDDASILVDPGLDDPDTPATQEMLADWEGMTLSPGLQVGLTQIGVQPEDITHVLLSHGHFDHYLAVTMDQDGRQIPRFPNARYIINRREWEDNPDREPELVERLHALEARGLLSLVDGDEEIAPGVTIIHAPGESPGHSIVRVSSAGQQLYAVGDLFHHTCEVENLDWAPAGRDRAAMRASRERLIIEAVPHDAIVVFTHAALPPWGRIVETEGGYRWVRVDAEE
ncbi:MAG TPA: MBL fold metallo-hydrolase [Chloroflexota bacterium]